MQFRPKQRFQLRFKEWCEWQHRLSRNLCELCERRQPINLDSYMKTPLWLHKIIFNVRG